MKRIIIVLLILAGLGAYTYFVEIKGKQAEERKEKRQARIVKLHESDVRRIVIDNEHGHIELEKIDGEWRLTVPVEARADEGAVNSLLTTLTSAETKERIDSPAALSVYGLDPAVRSIMVYGDKVSEGVRIGKKSPVSQDVYVQRIGEPAVYQAGSGLAASPARKPDELRDKRLFTFSADDVAAITIRKPGETLVIERHGDEWALTQPKSIKVDNGLVKGLAQDVANIRANNWVVENATAADLAAHGLQNAQSRVTVALADGTEHTLLFGTADGNDRRARVDGRPQVVTVADWSVQQVLKSPEELRDRRLFAVAADSVGRLVFKTAGGQEVAFSRQADGWSLSGTVSGMADSGKVDELLSALEDYRANEWKAATRADLKAKGLAPPRRTLEAWSREGEKVAQLSFGDEEDGWAIWVQTDDPNSVAKATGDFVRNKWPEDPTLYLEGSSAQPDGLPPGE